MPGVEQEMLSGYPGEVAAEMVAVDELHFAEAVGREPANGCAVKRNLGELGGVEAQRGCCIGMLPCHAVG